VRKRKCLANDVATVSYIECRDIPHRLTVPHLQERVGIHQKLKIGFYLCEYKALERRIRSQHWNVLA
jgi:hypothetical protein